MTDNDREQLNQMLVGVAHGETDCLDGISEILGGRMYAVARNVVRDGDMALDVVSESFIKIARFARKYKRGTNAAAWILRVVYNTALDMLRKYGRSEANAELLFLRSPPTADGSPEAMQRSLELEEALGKLEPKERQIITLRYYLDMTVAEAAEAAGLSRSSADRLIKKAEEKLKNLL